MILLNTLHTAGLLQLHTSGLATPEYLSAPPAFVDGEIASIEVYFGPAVRSMPAATKDAVLGTMAFWVDIDNPATPMSTLPPSFTVWSGHGWHLYWLLRSMVTKIDIIEYYNKLLIADVPHADKNSWNANRLLRVPGSMNLKQPDDPVRVELRRVLPIAYDLRDFDILKSLTTGDKHLLRTGDSRSFRSRSERDFRVIKSLLTAGASDELIATIFAHQPIGDKVRDKETSASYLTTSIENAKTAVVGGGSGDAVKEPEPSNLVAAIEEREDGFYIVTKRGESRISTFTLTPQLLLDGYMFKSPDAIVCDVHADGRVWTDVTFPRGAFNSTRALDQVCGTAAWQWLGNDTHLRNLLPWLMRKLREQGMPQVSATPVMGLHIVDGTAYFMGDRDVVSHENYWRGYSGPLAWLPSKVEHPTLDLEPRATPEHIADVARLVPLLNEPDVIWPMLGWYAATFLKPWIETQHLRFPILAASGSTGSGKTSLIQRIMLPLFGGTEPKSFDAGTTKFVILALLGGSNAIPVAFSEFRYTHAESFLRYILLAYDTGHDPRGRSDQTTVDYPLSAPFSLDGEDLIADPAAMQRLVVALLSPATVRDTGSPAYQAFRELEGTLNQGFAGWYVQQLLAKLASGELKRVLQEARSAISLEYGSKLPDRVRNNHTIALFGAYLFADAVGIVRPPTNCMTRSIKAVFDIEHGRAKLLIDTMVEAVINHCRRSGSSITRHYVREQDTGREILYIQLTTAHDWWLKDRRRQGRDALELNALRAQLREAPYFVDSKVMGTMLMYGIDILKAFQAGLEIPNTLVSAQFSSTNTNRQGHDENES